MLSVISNLAAMNAQRQFNITGGSIKKSMEKLSSGYRINRAADDAAGLTISEKMRSLIRGMNQGSDNIQDGISVMQIADGALAEVHGMLHRMTELSVKASNGTNTPADRQAIQSEMNELSAEITRIGKTTEYNTLHILDDITETDGDGKITTLVSCDSANKGYFGEAIKVGNSWFSAATVDFSGINENNINRLNDGGFSFCCSRGCGEVFDFKFKTDGTPTSATNLSGKVHHYYTVDIRGCRSGEDIVNKIFNAVRTYPPTNNSPESVNMLPGAVAVSHSNNMVKTADGKGLTIYSNRRVASYGSYLETGYSSEEAAKNAYPLPNYPASSSHAGSIDCTSLTRIVSEDVTNRFRIQCSNITDDCEYIETYRMNATVLGVDFVNVSTENAARGSIAQIDRALDRVSWMRSAYGAFQNRLEHSYDNNNNKAENMTAAESRIRDTDMAKEMVRFSISNILSQVGNAMLSQASQEPQAILKLLQ